MTNAGTVLKNSIWLVVQPLILNIISLFIVGYIARSLGVVDYGKFNVAFAFVALFTPFINMGLGALTTREIAEKRGTSEAFFWKIVMLRIILGNASFIAVAFAVNVLNYPSDTRMVVYIAGSTLLFQSISISCNSAFQGFEKMQYIAYTNFISGLVLTLLSLVILFAGYRLIGLTLVYAFGSLLGMILAIYYLKKIFPHPKFIIDIDFWKTSLRHGLPFFIPGLLFIINMKIGFIFLSKISGETFVGVYSAAYYLIEKLFIIPDGICTAIFPTLAILHQKSHREAGELFKRFNLYMFLFGLPLAIGVMIIAEPIISLIYGTQYHDAVLVLQIMIWWFFLLCHNWIQTALLNAVHQEKVVIVNSIISSAAYIILNYLLILKYGALGAPIACVISATISILLLHRPVHNYIAGGVSGDWVYMKIMFASLVMAGVLFLLRTFSIFLSAPVAAVSYVLMVLYLKILSKNELSVIYNKIMKC